ncbi:hypothetical protein M5E87_16860 [Flavonifractor plautii]|nr:hypothetical protein M5E87_16860 [Flavonifractor plautii]
MLLTMTVTFAKGFDMDKYIAAFTASDFILADAGHFQTGGEVFNPDMALPEDAVEEVEARGGITVSGRTTAAPPRWRSSSLRSTTARCGAGGTTRKPWIRWCPAWTARRTACWPTGPSSTVWSGLPWTA